MRVYYHDNEPVSPSPSLTSSERTNPHQGGCRLPHLSNHVLSPSHLTQLSILYYTIPPSFPYSSSCVETTAQTRNYANRDEITVSPSAMGATYEDRIKMFFDEHMHEDEEIRWIQDGEGYFDVRDADDWWVRIEAEVGILLVLPAGIYHRFTVDEGNVSGCMGWR